MKKIGSLFILTLCFNGYSQLNLVPNPSFEAHNYCAPAVVGNSNPGGVVLQDWYNPNTHTPDYYNACWMTPPPQNFVYQIVDGDGFVGIATYNANFVNVREYVACQLLDTLQTGELYQVSFYARHFSGRSYYASNNLGIHFSDTALHANDPYTFNMNAPSMLEAQVKYFNNEIISDSAHWTLVSGLYQADGGETWLTIGNFNKDEETAQGMEYTNGSAPGTYFVIDMVSVIPLDSLPAGIPAHAGADTTIFINDTAFIGQKISNMPSNWHLLDGTLIATNTAGLYVSPQETTSYVVSHTLNGIFSADTVTVTVIDNLVVEELEEQRFELYPIPNNGSFYLAGRITKGDRLSILSAAGKTVFETELDNSGHQLLINSKLNSGIYFVLIRSKEGVEQFKSKIVIIE
jgi:hypothetical protein